MMPTTLSMNTFLFPVTILLLCALTACGPAYTVSRYGVKTRLIDAGSKQPLDRVKTRIVIDRQEFPRTSGRDGHVSVKPDLDWHISWLGGPALISRAGANIGLEAEGYREKAFTWENHRPSGDSPFSEERGVVDLGTVELEKR
jgi:hypothetical protein